MSFSNAMTPRVRRFARFANAAYMVQTVTQANRLITWAELHADPGFHEFARAQAQLLEDWGLLAEPAHLPQRLPRPQEQDVDYIPAPLLKQWHENLLTVAKRAYNRSDITAIARGSLAPAHETTKRGRTIYDKYGKPICRVLQDGADAELYRILRNNWEALTPGQTRPAPDDDDDDTLDFL